MARSRPMSQISVHRRTLILGVGLLASFAACGQVATPTPANVDSRFAVLAVSMNGFRQSDGTVFVQSKSGRLFASATFFAELNLKHSTESLMGVNQIQYFELDSVAGLRYSVDSPRGELSLLATADAFIANSLDIGAALPLAIPPYTPGAFLNYEWSILRGGGANGSQGLFEAGAFAGKGLLTSSFTEGSAGGKRLMTTFRSDQVGALKSL